MTYSIKLDVLRAIVAERHAWISESLAVEEARATLDAALIAALDEERARLPNWASYSDERTIDAEIDRWRAIVDCQRSE